MRPRSAVHGPARPPSRTDPLEVWPVPRSSDASKATVQSSGATIGGMATARTAGGSRAERLIASRSIASALEHRRLARIGAGLSQREARRGDRASQSEVGRFERGPRDDAIRCEFVGAPLRLCSGSICHPGPIQRGDPIRDSGAAGAPRAPSGTPPPVAALADRGAAADPRRPARLGRRGPRPQTKPGEPGSRPKPSGSQTARPWTSAASSQTP